MCAETKTWNPDTCYSEDDLAMHVKHFIADCVQQGIMGLPSQALAAVVITFATILGNKNEKECISEEEVVSLEEYCKKVCCIHKHLEFLSVIVRENQGLAELLHTG